MLLPGIYNILVSWVPPVIIEKLSKDHLNYRYINQLYWKIEVTGVQEYHLVDWCRLVCQKDGYTSGRTLKNWGAKEERPGVQASNTEPLLRAQGSRSLGSDDCSCPRQCDRSLIGLEDSCKERERKTNNHKIRIRGLLWLSQPLSWCTY